MSSGSHHPVPTEINLHRKSRLPSIRFADSRPVKLPCKYLRAFSPTAEDEAYLLTDERLRVKVNRQLAEPFTRLAGGDEVARVGLHN
jgi:DUF971 family protein